MYIVEINPTQTWTDDGNGPGFLTGTRGCDSDGNEYLCIKAGADCGAYDFVICSLASAEGAQPITKALLDAALNAYMGVPVVDIADDEYGWMMINGLTSVQALASTLAMDELYTTATAGALHEDSSSQTQIYGVSLTEATGSGGTAATPCRLRYPTGLQ